MHGAFSSNQKLTKHAVRSRKGVVAAQNRKAAAVGAEVLADGGNAMDAAIATSLALGATEPWMSGLGGGGVLIHRDGETGKTTAIDFGMIAPKALDPTRYPLVPGRTSDLFPWPAVEDDRNARGPLSMAVPGYLAGLGLASEKLGSMPFPSLVRPAMALAIQGLEVDWYSSLVIAGAAAELSLYPSSASRYLPDGLPPVPPANGEIRRILLEGLAESLQMVAAEGPETLYRGALAETILQDLAEVGSPIGRDDLESYRASAVEPLRVGYGEAVIHTMPGLYAGASLGRALALLSEHRFGGDWPDENAFLAYVSALSKAYAERLATMGASGDAAGQSCTSHLSVVDAKGDMVSLTQTLLSLFGSRVVLPQSGILMNNGILWFDPQPGKPNSMVPGGRPLSNMCPVIAETEQLLLGLGASGGRRILPAVTQVLSFILDYHMSLEEAFAQARIDVSGGELVTVSADLRSPIPETLAAHHTTVVTRAMVYPKAFACPVATLHDRADGHNYGTAEVIHPWADAVAEPRR